MHGWFRHMFWAAHLLTRSLHSSFIGMVSYYRFASGSDHGRFVRLAWINWRHESWAGFLHKKWMTAFANPMSLLMWWTCLIWHWSVWPYVTLDLDRMLSRSLIFSPKYPFSRFTKYVCRCFRIEKTPVGCFVWMMRDPPRAQTPRGPISICEFCNILLFGRGLYAKISRGTRGFVSLFAWRPKFAGASIVVCPRNYQNCV
jgi:hypothetical protein